MTDFIDVRVSNYVVGRQLMLRKAFRNYQLNDSGRLASTPKLSCRLVWRRGYVTSALEPVENLSLWTHLLGFCGL